MPRKKISTREEAVFSVSRAKILSLIKNNPMTISELSKNSGMSRRTIYHHIEELKRRGLVYEKKYKNKQGQPLMITTNKAKPLTPLELKFIEGISKLLPKRRL